MAVHVECKEYADWIRLCVMKEVDEIVLFQFHVLKSVSVIYVWLRLISYVYVSAIFLFKLFFSCLKFCSMFISKFSYDSSFYVLTFLCQYSKYKVYICLQSRSNYGHPPWPPASAGHSVLPL